MQREEEIEKPDLFISAYAGNGEKCMKSSALRNGECFEISLEIGCGWRGAMWGDLGAEILVLLETMAVARKEGEKND